MRESGTNRSVVHPSVVRVVHAPLPFFTMPWSWADDSLSDAAVAFLARVCAADDDKGGGTAEISEELANELSRAGILRDGRLFDQIRNEAVTG